MTDPIDDSRFAVIAEMSQAQATDDTESGINVTSAIVEQAKRRKKVLTAHEELQSVPVLYSHLNDRAIAAQFRRQQETLAKGNQKDYDQPYTTAAGDDKEVASRLLTEEEPTVLIPFRTNVPLKGKTAFTVHHRMSEQISVLRTEMINALGITPTGTITIHRSDTGEVLPLHSTLLDCGFRFPPLLRVHGFAQEVYLVGVSPLRMRYPVGWSPAMSLTDLVRHVHQRLRPRDLRHVRLSIALTEGQQQQQSSMSSSSCCPTCGGKLSSNVSSSRRFFNILPCLSYREPQYLNLDQTINAAGLCKSLDDPVSINFLRTKDGVPLWFQVPVTGSMLLSEFHQLSVDIFSSSASAERLLDAHVNGPDFEATLQMLHSETPFDDEDEEVRMLSQPVSTTPLPKTSSDGAFAKALYRWTPNEVARIFGDAVAQRVGVVVSYNPSPRAVAESEPRFISVEEDYLVPHLADIGIVPGTEVLVEFYDPMTLRWSGDVVPLLERHIPPSESSTAQQCELLTIRSTMSTSLVRVPCFATTPFDVILLLYWASTGELPMFTVLQTDGNRLLAPFLTMASANLLPQVTLYGSRRPRVWLKESLADVTKLGGHVKAFSTVTEPTC